MNPRIPRYYITVLALLAGAAIPLQAQTPAAPAEKNTKQDEPVTLTTFVVTGSNLRLAADESDVPVTVIGQQQLQQTGVDANLLEVLRKRIPAFSGRSNAGSTNATNTNQNTAGGSQIALRNLDTLVLINGRRISTSGINGVGGKSFVDISQIPVAAIERMEVLTDGASAIYGSDAIGGVVNIILKSDYQGAEVGGRYAFTTNTGHYAERSGYVVAGASVDKMHLTVTGSWSKTDPLWQYQRPFINPNLRTGTTFPGFVSGNYLAPAYASAAAHNPTGTAATASGMADLIANGTYLAAGNPAIPLFDLAPYQSILLQADERAAIANGSYDLMGKKLVAFGDYMHTEGKSSNQSSGFLGNLRAVTVPAGSPYNPTTVALAGVVMGTTATPLQTFNDAKGDRFTIGLRGEFNADWNWEGGYTYSDNKLTQRLTNEVYVPNLTAAIAGGFDSSGAAVAGGKFSKVLSLTNGATVVQPALDPFARSGVDSASQANVYGTEVIKTESKLTSFDLKLVGTLFSLPAGKVGVAVGAASRKETLIGTPDQNSYNLSTDPTKHNWGPGTFFDPFAKSRTITSFFAETRVPLFGSKLVVPAFHALDLSVAGRTEKYSDAGKSNVPKIGLRWAPFDEQFAVRFTYSKSFTAPSLYQEYGPPSTAQRSSDLYFNNLTGPGGALIGDVRTKGIIDQSGNGNNPDLQPSTAQSRSLGFVLTPKAVKGLSVSVDYTNVTQVGLPAGLGSAAIIASVNSLGSASPYFNAISVGGFPGAPGSSQTQLAAPQGLYNYLVSGSYANNIYMLDHFVNSGLVHIEAFDFNVAYELRDTSAGHFTLTTAGSYLQHFQVQDLPGALIYEDAGYSTNGKTMSGTLPHLRLYTTLEWVHHRWGALVGNNYFGSSGDIGSGAIPSVYLQTNAPSTVSSYMAWDAQLSYTFDKAAAGNIGSLLKGMKVAIGVDNLGNRMPPLALRSNPAGANNNNVDVSTYSPIGRLWFVSADVKF